MTDHTSLAPLRFFEYDHRPGTYCLMLTDTAMVDVRDTFEEHGYDAGGYAWAGVARAAVRVRAPELEGRLGHDPEAGMFVAHGTDEEALLRLGALLHEAFHDPKVLAEFIAAGDPSWFD
ncbi:Imm51 family immunity protein [Nocardiopsis lucentensis]|uniref:Imm51 family immunity protein n=1 Tax=Nocardiopsis lucentensis TaxID=53441 RepID=UPI00034CA42F|nr:Imm51 family immunity protein [Nocardiopsis lucentensis]